MGKEAYSQSSKIRLVSYGFLFLAGAAAASPGDEFLDTDGRGASDRDSV
jgi:hypothetical protein